MILENYWQPLLICFSEIFLKLWKINLSVTWLWTWYLHLNVNILVEQQRKSEWNGELCRRKTLLDVQQLDKTCCYILRVKIDGIMVVTNKGKPNAKKQNFLGCTWPKYNHLNVIVDQQRSTKNRKLDQLDTGWQLLNLACCGWRWIAGQLLFTSLDRNRSMPANCPDFIRTAPIFDFQNLQKSGHPDFLEFQLVNIPLLK